MIPYDRNRVILTPIGNENSITIKKKCQQNLLNCIEFFHTFLGPQPSTYINATFIEGYDNSESFIITQDPMEDTIGDFWRMISEQSISTIVMISEV